MPMHLDDPLHSMARVYNEICKGEHPWVALGNFMNDWFLYVKDRREDLVAEPLTLREYRGRYKNIRWAVFIVASVEWFCERYGIPCPDWVHDPRYCLERKWWFEKNAKNPKIRAMLVETTPEPFTRRNVYCGNRMYANKYEMDDIVAKLKEIKARKAQQKAAEAEGPGKTGMQSLPELARTES